MAGLASGSNDDNNCQGRGSSVATGCVCVCGRSPARARVAGLESLGSSPLGLSARLMQGNKGEGSAASSTASRPNANMRFVCKSGPRHSVSPPG